METYSFYQESINCNETQIVNLTNQLFFIKIIKKTTNVRYRPIHDNHQLLTPTTNPIVEDLVCGVCDIQQLNDYLAGNSEIDFDRYALVTSEMLRSHDSNDSDMCLYDEIPSQCAYDISNIENHIPINLVDNAPFYTNTITGEMLTMPITLDWRLSADDYNIDRVGSHLRQLSNDGHLNALQIHNDIQQYMFEPDIEFLNISFKLPTCVFNEIFSTLKHNFDNIRIKHFSEYIMDNDVLSLNNFKV